MDATASLGLRGQTGSLTGLTVFVSTHLFLDLLLIPPTVYESVIAAMTCQPHLTTSLSRFSSAPTTPKHLNLFLSGGNICSFSIYLHFLNCILWEVEFGLYPPVFSHGYTHRLIWMHCARSRKSHPQRGVPS